MKGEDSLREAGNPGGRAPELAFALTTTTQDTLHQKLDSLDHHSSLRIHLDDASRALAAARSALEAPQPPLLRTHPPRRRCTPRPPGGENDGTARRAACSAVPPRQLRSNGPS
ncbi:hypothetical protein SSTG_05721 [Streptomyces sp. e14]|nr:hypothetical protein SSTG_05721 [Streptomyces sp. e14]